MSTQNFSPYGGDANSNTWIDGTEWGLIGINDVGGGKNVWIHPDIEGATTHGMVLGGGGTSVISPYEEAIGCDLLNGSNDMIIGPMSYGGGSWTPCTASTDTTSFWWGPDTVPNTIALSNWNANYAGIYFGSNWMNGSQGATFLSRGSGSKYAPLDFNYTPYSQSNYGLFGHAPVKFGGVTSLGGITANGRSTVAVLANPSAPSIISGPLAAITSGYGCSVVGTPGQTVLLTGFNGLTGATATGTLTQANTISAARWLVTNGGSAGSAAATSATCSAGTVTSASGTATVTTVFGGTPGSTTYQYSAVCHDWNSGVSLQSPTGSTTTGNATLDTNNFNAIYYGCPDGYEYADLLEYSGGTWQSLALNVGPSNGNPPSYDKGTVLSAYTVPTRNTTGDVSITGYHSAAQYSIGANAVLPTWLTGNNGNSSGVKLPLAVAWGTPSAITSICHDANGNITDSVSCPAGFTAGGDLSGTPTSQVVGGINGVHLCTGFSPTSGQLLKYTTASSPNPCYTAVTIAGGGNVTGPGSSTTHDVATYADTTGATLEDTGIPTSGGKILPAGGGVGAMKGAPSYYRYFGDGSDGAYTCTSGTCTLYAGEKWYSSVNISSGAIVAVGYNSTPLIIRSTGTCTIAGTISYSPNTGSAAHSIGTSTAVGGGGGGGGGGTAAGAAGGAVNTQQSSGNSGAAGTAGGGAGGNGGTPAAVWIRNYLTVGPLGMGSGVGWWGGAQGGNGGSSGGTGGAGGGAVILACPTISFTGAVDVSGVNGGNSTGNNIGAGGGGGGGVVVMSTITYSSNSGTINVAGSSGGSCLAYTGCGAGGTGAAGNSFQWTIQ